MGQKKPTYKKATIYSDVALTADYDNIDGLSLPVDENGYYIVCLIGSSIGGAGNDNAKYRITRGTDETIVDYVPVYIDASSDRIPFCIYDLVYLSSGETIYAQGDEDAGSVQIAAYARLFLIKIQGA